MGERILFTCAICERPVRMWGMNHGRDEQIAPVCRYCEKHYGSRAPQAGAFRDRRKAVQISALAEALSSRARIMQWEGRYVRA